MAFEETHPNSTKVHVGPLRVPVREIALSGGELLMSPGEPTPRSANVVSLPGAGTSA